MSHSWISKFFAEIEPSIFRARFNDLSSSEVTNLKGKNAESYSTSMHYFVTDFFFFSEHKEFLLREITWKKTATRANTSTSGLSTRGAAYLKFMLPSKMKVDKTFLHCHRWEEKHKWILTALYLFLHILQENDFPAQSIFAKIYLWRNTVIQSNLCKILPWCSKKKNYSVWYVLLFSFE